MKIVIACDSFKGSLNSAEIGKAAEMGVLSVYPQAETVIIDIADGGEGTVDAIVRQLGGEFRYCYVEGPLGDKVRAKYGICERLAIIEMAEASGLPLIPEYRRNPLMTSSYGTGELILDALRNGCREFLVGLGGSATNDGGVGMLQALGYRFLDENGKEIGKGGGEVGRITEIDDREVIPEIKDCKFTVACDVDTPLTGERGASHIFAPQKGADENGVEILENSLRHFSEIVADYLGMDYSDDPGVGAAGGMGFAFRVFLGGNLKPGIELLLDVVGFDKFIAGAELVITGEGCLDRQTLSGKAPIGVLKRAKSVGVPVVGIGGKISDDAVEDLENCGFKALFPIVNGPVALPEAMAAENARRNVQRTVREILRLLNLNRI